MWCGLLWTVGLACHHCTIGGDQVYALKNEIVFGSVRELAYVDDRRWAVGSLHLLHWSIEPEHDEHASHV